MQKFCRDGQFPKRVLPRVTKIIKANIPLTRKGGPFVWGKEQDSFEEIKCGLFKSPVLHMPNTTGRFHLYSDTSKFATGSTAVAILIWILMPNSEWKAQTDCIH